MCDVTAVADLLMELVDGCSCLVWCVAVQHETPVASLCMCVEWSREMLLEAWIDDPVACCEKCGVVPPSTVVPDHGLQPRDTDAGSAFALPLPMPQFMVS